MGDIAARAGVSRSSVSKVLNQHADTGRISAETQEIIWKVAREMGYRRNELARTVVSGKSRMLGFLGGFPEREHVGYMLGGALEEAEKAGYSMKVFGVLGGDTGRASIERCAELRLSGVIALRLHPELTSYLQEEMDRYHIPVVFLDMSRSLHAQLGAYLGVYSDDMAGIRAGLEHLVSLGHQEIAFIGGDYPQGSSIEHRGRIALYEMILEELGLPKHPHFSVYAGSYWDVDVIEPVVRNLLEASVPPTAIMCANDFIAMTVIRSASQLGLRIPDDVSVIGFGNFLMSRCANPALTTIAQPFHEMGRTAVQHLLRQAQQQEAPSKVLERQYLPTELVVRESTAPRLHQVEVPLSTELIIRRSTAPRKTT